MLTGNLLSPQRDICLRRLRKQCIYLAGLPKVEIPKLTGHLNNICVSYDRFLAR